MTYAYNIHAVRTHSTDRTVPYSSRTHHIYDIYAFIILCLQIVEESRMETFLFLWIFFIHWTSFNNNQPTKYRWLLHMCKTKNDRLQRLAMGPVRTVPRAGLEPACICKRMTVTNHEATAGLLTVICIPAALLR